MAAPRSVRMSPKRLEATMTSRLSGRETNRAEQDASKASQLKHSKPILRHQRALAQVALGAPVEVLRLQAEAAVKFGQRLERLDTFRDDLWPNPITRQHGDLVVAHRSSSLFI